MWISTSNNRIANDSGWTILLVRNTVKNLLVRAVFGLASFVAMSRTCAAQQWLDQLETGLSLKNPSGSIHSDLTVLLDVEGYYVDQRPPGLIFDDESFINPRATFYIDTMLGSHLYSFVQARVDRGFDPGQKKDGDARLDEYLLRWTPLEEKILNVQFGKFATVVGNWVPRHDSWENPLITPPLPYANLTTVSDDDPPTSPGDFLMRRSLPDDKGSWLPVIWGPAYTTGWALLGTISRFDYAFEIKNAAISSHPDEWELSNNLWQNPTYSGRLGFRPNPAWNHGISFSIGPYLYSEAQPFLPPGKGLNDYNEIVLDYDVSYAWHHWQFWGEVFLTRFEVPNVGNADVLTYYLEARYQITSGLYVAGRWNQQIFGGISDGTGGQQTWDNNMIQLDLALGYRFTRHLQAKIQYSFNHRHTSLQQGEHLVAAQVTMKF